MSGPPSATVSAAASAFGAKAGGATVNGSAANTNNTTVIPPTEKDAGVVETTHMYTDGPKAG